MALVSQSQSQSQIVLWPVVSQKCIAAVPFVPLESDISLFQPRVRPLPVPAVQQLALDLAGSLPNSESCQMLGNRAYAGESYISGYDR